MVLTNKQRVVAGMGTYVRGDDREEVFAGGRASPWWLGPVATASLGLEQVQPQSGSE